MLIKINRALASIFQISSAKDVEKTASALCELRKEL